MPTVAGWNRLGSQLERNLPRCVMGLGACAVCFAERVTEVSPVVGYEVWTKEWCGTERMEFKATRI